MGDFFYKIYHPFLNLKRRVNLKLIRLCKDQFDMISMISTFIDSLTNENNIASILFRFLSTHVNSTNKHIFTTHHHHRHSSSKARLDRHHKCLLTLYIQNHSFTPLRHSPYHQHIHSMSTVFFILAS